MKDLYAQAVAHMKNIPDGHVPWPETVVSVPAGRADLDPEGLPWGYACGPDCIGCEIEREYPPATTRVVGEAP